VPTPRQYRQGPPDARHAHEPGGKHELHEERHHTHPTVKLTQERCQFGLHGVRPSRNGLELIVYEGGDDDHQRDDADDQLDVPRPADGREGRFVAGCLGLVVGVPRGPGLRPVTLSNPSGKEGRREQDSARNPQEIWTRHAHGLHEQTRNFAPDDGPKNRPRAQDCEHALRL